MFSTATELAAKGTAALAKNDLEKGAKKIKSKVKKALGNAEEAINDDNNVITDISDSANKIGEQMRAWLDGAAVQAKDNAQKVESQIKSNPVQSSLIALGVGVVLGALLSRKPS
jgi:ElaB/YqjD/DUF883 family membrane-anchored ribosome-binding protein